MNKPEDIYDESMVRKQGWIFYGESKPNIPPYALQGVFKYTPGEDKWEDDEEAYTSRQLLELLSVRYEIVKDHSVVIEESKDQYEAMKVWGRMAGAWVGRNRPWMLAAVERKSWPRTTPLLMPCRRYIP